MRKVLFAVTMSIIFLTAGANAQGWQDGWLSRYWDGCKLHCNWTGNASRDGGIGVAGVCNRQNESQTPNDQVQSACQNTQSGQYVCWDHAPVAIDANLSYAFVAVNPGGARCGQCFEMEFTGVGARSGTKGPAPTGSTHQALAGKRMIVMTTNIGGDVENTPIRQFDVLIPGGGVGQFDAISTQLGHNRLGHIWGGYLRDPCNSSNVLATAQSCLRTQCENLGDNLLREGCLWHANWMMAANNPEVRWRETPCPAELVTWYRNPKQRPAGCRNGICGGDGPGPNPTTHTLTINRNPTAGGTVTPASGGSHAANTPVNISATANSGYTFANWTATGSGATFANANNANTTVTLTANATITANFNTSGSGGGGRRDTTRIEAEAFTSRNGDNIRVEQIPGESSSTIGWIENGNSTTYNNVNVSQAGSYTMQFRIALNQADVSSSTITVNINGSQAGTLTSNGTGGWDTYQIVTLNPPNVQLRQGNNTVVLNFGNAINVDYFQFIGEVVSVRHNAVRSAPYRTQVTLKSVPRGFNAILPANHTYTSYKLVNLQGKEIQSGQIGTGVTDLRFNNLRNSVMLLKLQGKDGSTTVVRAVIH